MNIVKEGWPTMNLQVSLKITSISCQLSAHCRIILFVIDEQIFIKVERDAHPFDME